MKFYSTNNQVDKVTFKEALMQSLPKDNGLYMPEEIPNHSKLIKGISELDIKDISFVIAESFLNEDFKKSDIEEIIDYSITFDSPLLNILGNFHILELFHGPTLAFKDFGARFMARAMEKVVTNYNKEFNNGQFIYDQINKNAQTILMNYLNNGGRLIFNTLTLSSKFNINLDTSWGELTKAIYSVNDGASWSVDIDTNSENKTAYLTKEGGFPNGPSNSSSQATIKQTNTSPILNNVPNEFTWNPSSLEGDNGFDKFTSIGYFENLQTNNYVLNTTSELTTQQGNKFTYPFFLSNSFF